MGKEQNALGARYGMLAYLLGFLTAKLGSITSSSTKSFSTTEILCIMPPPKKAYHRIL